MAEMLSEYLRANGHWSGNIDFRDKCTEQLMSENRFMCEMMNCSILGYWFCFCAVGKWHNNDEMPWFQDHLHW